VPSQRRPGPEDRRPPPRRPPVVVGRLEDALAGAHDVHSGQLAVTDARRRRGSRAPLHDDHVFVDERVEQRFHAPGPREGTTGSRPWGLLLLRRPARDHRRRPAGLEQVLDASIGPQRPLSRRPDAARGLAEAQAEELALEPVHETRTVLPLVVRLAIRAKVALRRAVVTAGAVGQASGSFVFAHAGTRASAGQLANQSGRNARRVGKVNSLPSRPVAAARAARSHKRRPTGEGLVHGALLAKQLLLPVRHAGAQFLSGSAAPVHFRSPLPPRARYLLARAPSSFRPTPGTIVRRAVASRPFRHKLDSRSAT
ncbi:unnamed protein product, partial [Ixodes pacificus]